MPPRKTAGYITLTEPGKTLFEADTLQCCHCSAHYQVVPGSGKIRGFCRNCMKPTCGKPECDVCVPFEKKLDEMERNDRRIVRV